MTSRRSTAEGTRLVALLGPVVEAAGYDLEEVSVAKMGRRSIVRVVVDADGGISLDAVAALSRAVSDALDQDGYSGSSGATSYTLEVSSPGVDRPLSEPRHWRRNVDRLVRTKIGDTAVEGRVIAADADHVELDVAGTVRSVPYVQLGKGTVQVEFARREGGDR